MADKNFLLINKPEGWTSFDVVAWVRKQLTSIVIPTAVEESLKPKRKGSLHSSEDSVEMTSPTKQKLRVGHAGTLDPFATGLLIVGVGREATKRLDEFKAMPKTYIATIKLGEVSDTYDKTGEIKKIFDEYLTNIKPNIKKIKETVKSFAGKQLQIPPMFSAKKINGKRLYELARKGIEVERQPNEIEIYKIKILHYSWPFLKIAVQCSAGTYIRSLANDLGAKLGTGAYCQDLTRTKIGKYSLNKARRISGQARDINGLTISL